MRYLIITTLLFSISCAYFYTSESEDNFIYTLLKDKPEFENVLQQAGMYEIQVLYTQIDRDAQNKPSFTNYSWRLDEQQYFYPASTVKLPAALLALEKLNNLNVDGLDKYTKLTIDSSFGGQSRVLKDVTSKDSSASIAHYIKKIFLVSDNDAYNRLYEFLGQGPFNQMLWDKGYKNIAIRHRLSIALSDEENRHTNPFTFRKEGKIVYKQPGKYNENRIVNPLENLKRGNGYFKDGKIVSGPFDFSDKNYFSLQTMHDILKAVLFPEAVDPQKRFNLTADDYQFVYKYMSMLPGESDYPKYDSKQYWDSYVKFFMFGDNKKPMPDNIRIFNKVGDAYGYLIDNAYIADFENKIEFMLSAVIHVNANRIFNDNVYEYDEIGFPFLAHLGKVIYEYELERERKYSPDLEKFRMEYKSVN